MKLDGGKYWEKCQVTAFNKESYKYNIIWEDTGLSLSLKELLEWSAGPRPASAFSRNVTCCLTLREPSQSNSPEPSNIFRCHVFFWWETITWAFPIGRMSLDALNLLPFRLAWGQVHDLSIYLSIYRWHHLFLSTVKLSENRLKPGQTIQAQGEKVQSRVTVSQSHCTENSSFPWGWATAY